MKLQKIRAWSRKKKIIAGTAAGIAIVLAASGILIHLNENGAQAKEMTVQSSEAKKGNIQTTVEGTGSIRAAGGEEVAVPLGITVKKVLVESGETVKKGQKLATVESASAAAKLLEVKEELSDVKDELADLSGASEGSDDYLKATVLKAQKKELTKTKKALQKILKKKAITASCVGIISDIAVSDGTEVSESTQAQSSTSGSSSDSSSSSSGSSVTKTSETVNTTTGTVIKLAATDEDTGSASGKTSINSVKLDITAPGAGQKPQTEIKDTKQYKGEITWNCSGKTFAEKTAYTADITLTAKDGYVFSSSIVPKVSGADVTSEVVESDAGESILHMKAKYTKTSAAKTSDNKTKTEDKTAGSSKTTGISGGTEAAGTNAGSMGTSGSGGSTATAGSTVSTTSDTSETTSSDVSYNEYETAGFVIASNKKVMVSVQVDELDIVSVKKGQTATVTLDALENKSFEGKITSVSNEGSTDSSSVKYPVEITFEKTSGMKIGMSASATINIAEATDAVLIPVDALQEQGDSTYVYTKKDSDDNLSGKTEVETGLSNGSQVEITSGLSEGDMVYYMKNTSSEDSSSDKAQMPGGGQGGGSDMPGGGNGNGGPGNGQQPPSDMKNSKGDSK